MSKAIIWQYNDFIQSRKEKLTNILISEIIFLKLTFKRNHKFSELSPLKYGLEKLEYLLNKLKIYGADMSEKDFDAILLLIYQIFREIAQNIE